MSLLKASVNDSAAWAGVSQTTHGDDLRRMESDSLIDSSLRLDRRRAGKVVLGPFLLITRRL
jgi:hypothetical protein